MGCRLAHYGWSGLFGVSMVAWVLAVLLAFYCLPALPVVLILWVGVLLFFRHPHRRIPEGEDLLVAPADGKVVGVEKVQGKGALEGECWRIDIFLSVLDVHINRAPCGGTVQTVTYQKGSFLNALKPEASLKNESNDVLLVTRKGVPVLVRQIAGIIARRIVCDCVAGDALDRGEPFGMIKFGSRTELYVPTNAVSELGITQGQRVRAGVSILGRLR